MSLQLVNTLATFGTFVVIAATAMAAIVQLRHMRSSNHITALNELRETRETADFRAAEHFVLTELPPKLQDPAFRHQIASPTARTDETRLLFGMIVAIGNFYESMGVLLKTGLIDPEPVFQIWADNVIGTWGSIAPVAAIYRRRVGDVAWENFEYLTVLSQRWKDAHPRGTYPRSVPRIGLKDEWLEADKQYAASFAPV
jgi:hypothetical protein